MTLCKPKIRATLVAVLLGGALLVAAGCGSDGDSSSTSATITKASFIKQADAICDKTEKRQLFRVDQYQTKTGSEGDQAPPSHEDEVKLVAFAGIPPVVEQIEELSDLPRPEKGAKEVEEFIAALEAGIKKAESDPELVLSREPDPFAPAAKAASKFGFQVCSGI